MKTLTVILVLASVALLAAALYWIVRAVKRGDKGWPEAGKGMGLLVGAFLVFLVAAVVEDDKKPQPVALQQDASPTSPQSSTPVPVSEPPVTNNDVLSYLDKLGTDPKAEGGDCMDFDTGTSCTWETNEYFERADSTWRSPTDYTILVVNPKFSENDVPEGFLQGPGGLNGGHAHYVTTNSGQINLSISSAANYQRLHQ